MSPIFVLFEFLPRRWLNQVWCWVQWSCSRKLGCMKIALMASFKEITRKKLLTWHRNFFSREEKLLDFSAWSEMPAKMEKIIMRGLGNWVISDFQERRNHSDGCTSQVKIITTRQRHSLSHFLLALTSQAYGSLSDAHICSWKKYQRLWGHSARASALMKPKGRLGGTWHPAIYSRTSWRRRIRLWNRLWGILRAVGRFGRICFRFPSE